MSHRTLESVRNRLHLNKREGWIAGVCSGLADVFNIDVAILRVGAAIAALFFTKVAIAVYLVAWLLLDERQA
jgi:phage shock protein PspC (stress-responsive transcriptional regulator)